MSDDASEAASIDEMARDFLTEISQCDRVLVEQKNALGAYDVSVVQGDTARHAYNVSIAAAYEAAAQDHDCGCEYRADVLNATGKADRWRACGRDPCGAEVARDIRALTPADAQAALDARDARIRAEEREKIEDMHEHAYAREAERGNLDKAAWHQAQAAAIRAMGDE